MSKRSLIPILTAVAVLAVTMSCGRKGMPSAQQLSEADSLFSAAKSNRDHNRVLKLGDSLYDAGAITLINAAKYRGNAYYNLGNYRLAEKEYRLALAEKPVSTMDSLDYYLCATALTYTLVMKGNEEEALQTGIPAIEALKKWYQEKPTPTLCDKLMNLTQHIGWIQKDLGMNEEGDKMFELCYSYMKGITSEVISGYYNRAAALANIIETYIGDEEYGMARKWLVRMDSLSATVAEKNGVKPEDSDFVAAMDYICRVRVAIGLDNPAEAERALEAFRNTQYAKTNYGRYDEAQALLKMKRYAEAADTYKAFDDYIAEYNIELSMDNLTEYGNKFEANYKADRRDSALAVAAYVFENLDSVIKKQKRNDAAELATIYETQQKDAEIARQQLKLSHQRWIATLVAMMLITAFFILYTLYRHRVARRIADMKAHQERIESELRVARDIQMSMVPSLFPDREGLDMYAAMMPAKEVGGDLYGYVLQDDRLYFAVGDVSGKGVPASLFMAQATRLFRTLASQGMMPAEICTRMNDALSGEDNENGMFVTFFLGLIDLTTGRLDFCNAGHNPPVIGGDADGGHFIDIKPNAPIGLWQGLEYEGEMIENIKGKPLFIYTDGLNEAENREQKQLGDDRLLDILRDTNFENARQVIETLTAAVEQHRNGAKPNDDLTMMSIRVN